MEGSSDAGSIPAISTTKKGRLLASFFNLQPNATENAKTCYLWLVVQYATKLYNNHRNHTNATAFGEEVYYEYR